ncbi:unnamed protein product [Linum tenue]|uniref:DUF4378 domain-containing protein n=1 Tax=Linum tenue TaxID=586396 RepID=A0AAV0NM53_9ROSI|nr:unnamed protein product [Linum tenue]
MEAERKRSKGGFFHMFDWNGKKSRKKLFPNNPELAEGTKPWKENVERGPKLQLHTIEFEDRRGNASTKASSSDLSCASSVTSDDAYGTRPASVVARLMGLDSMPTTSALTEPSSNQQLQPRIVRNSQYSPMDFLSVSGRMEMHHWRESRQPIERFQTETLPPRSAKSIPVTHHRLLSPIKCPGFISSKDVASIAEAAAKIMEASPRAVNNTTRVPSIGSPSVPMRIRDLKQKMEAAHRVSKPGTSSELGRNLKGQRRDESNSGSSLAGSSSFRKPPKASPEIARTKGKLVQQRPDGSSTRSNNSRIKPKEKNEMKSQQSMQRSVHKKAIENRSNVLKQNNQKQNNTLSRKGTSTSKQGGIAAGRASSGSSGSNRTVSTVSMNSEKEKRKAFSQKKQTINGDPPSNSGASATRLYNKDSRAINCKIAADECMKNTGNEKNSLDVVSFTFTSPMVRNNMSRSSLSSDGSTRNNIGLSMIGGDELGVLLERKLRELTDKMESGSLKSAPSVNVMGDTSSAAEQNVSELSLDKVELHKADGEWLSEEKLPLNSHPERQYQQSEETEEHSCSSSYIERGKELGSQPPSYTEWIPDQSCSDSQGSDQLCSSSAQAPTTLNSASTNRTLDDEELETELTDSATSSISIASHPRHTTSLILPATTTKHNNDPSNWELDYVSHILYSAEMNLEDLALSCSPSKIISPNLFEHEESNSSRSHDELSSKLNRKVMFDCVGEFLDYKCRQRSWGELRGVLLERKGWLAKELHKEILGWKTMGDMMVDELVDGDMSCGDGKWVDFGVEAFEEGAETADGILGEFIDELVCDLLIL